MALAGDERVRLYAARRATELRRRLIPAAIAAQCSRDGGLGVTGNSFTAEDARGGRERRTALPQRTRRTRSSASNLKPNGESQKARYGVSGEQPTRLSIWRGGSPLTANCPVLGG